MFLANPPLKSTIVEQEARTSETIAQPLPDEQSSSLALHHSSTSNVLKSVAPTTDTSATRVTRPVIDIGPQAKCKRKLTSIVSNDHESPIIVSSSPSKPTEFWIKELLLFPSDKQVLLSPVQWLNDNIINAAQKLCDATDSKGFQDVLLRQLKPIEPEHSFIQILHVDSVHWITVSNMKCKNNEVVIYDSRYTGLSLKSKLHVSSLMQKHNITHLKFLVASLCQQEDSCSCGLYAIATATELAFGSDPIVCQWNKSHMRSHLVQCLESKVMKPFPKDDRKRSRIGRHQYKVTIEEELYCICRQVNNTKRGMVSCIICKAWFHLDCMGLDEQSVPYQWKCTKHTLVHS